MDRIVYPFQRTFMNVMYIVVGIEVIGVSLLFCCPSILVGVGILSGLQSGDLLKISAEALVAWGGLCGVGIISPAFFLTGVLIIYFGSIPYEAALTSKTFTFGRRGWTKTLQLSEIASVSLSFYGRARMYPWTVIIQDSHQQRINLPIARWSTLTVGKNIFDYQVILRDLLQRLPPTAAVDASVKSFVVTGSFQ